MSEWAARCVQCNTSFTAEQIVGVFGCPSCGSKGVPMDPKQDVTVAINVHELRILGIWAEHYASDVDHKHLDDVSHEPLRPTVAAICARLEGQLRAVGQWMPLTMAAELKQLREAFPESDVTMYRNGHEEVDGI